VCSGRASKLAIDGGKPVRKTPFPPRGLITRAEKAAVVKLFDEAIATGQAPGYNGPCEQEYERRFVEFMGGGYADAVNSGTNAVFAALGALQLDAPQRGDRAADHRPRRGDAGAVRRLRAGDGRLRPAQLQRLR